MSGDGRDIPAEENVTTEDAAEMQPGPVEGRQPDERLERGQWQPPVESDPPPRVTTEDSGGGGSTFLTPQAESDQEHAEPADPGAEPEDQGIPDLQDGAPMQQRSSDPQQESVPGDTPTAVTQSAPTPAEMREGETLDERLAEEQPEESERQAVSGLPDEQAGVISVDPEAAPPRRQDVYGRETGDGAGLSPEEQALHEVDEEEVAGGEG